MIKISFLFFLLAFCLGFQNNSCNSKKKAEDTNNAYGPIKEIGPAESTSLAVFYKKGTSREQIEFFEKTVITIPRPDLGGYDLPDGVVSEYMIKNSDYEGMGINFMSNATEEQREKLKKAIKGSPIVHKIYENITPDKIKDL